MEPHDQDRLFGDDADEISTCLSDHPDPSPLVSSESLEKTLTSRKLHRFPGIPWLAAGYTVLAIFPWVITCISVFRPLTAKSYGLWLEGLSKDGYDYPGSGTYEKSQRWLHAARVIQAIVTVITIPLTSAVCSSAAVVFVQRKSRDSRLTLRQTTVLADNGWTDIGTYGHLLRGRWNRYGSMMLFLAIALNMLGSIISPLQSIFTTTRTVQCPRELSQVQQLTDLMDFFRLPSDDGVNQLAVANLRSILTTASSTDGQNHLWSGEGATNCSDGASASSGVCAFGQVSLTNISGLQDPFLAQLPAGYNTGVVRQFLPRINSSVTRERVTEDAFPQDCDTLPGAFYVAYSVSVLTGFINGSEVGPAWSLTACMPDDQRKSPWNDTRARQDFSESLYLNLSAWQPGNSDPTTPEQWSGYFKITANTTAGFFELPNYMNGNMPGPLLSDAPESHCGQDCASQYNSYSYVRERDVFPRTIIRKTAPEYNNSFTSEVTVNLGSVDNKGPLLTLALALFGPGSFVPERLAHSEAYIESALKASRYDVNYCLETMPFAGLLSEVADNSVARTDIALNRCVNDMNRNFGFLQMEILDYVQTLIYQPPGISWTKSYESRLQNGLAAAVFLANQLFLTSPPERSLSINFDSGASIEIPHISTAGILVISILLGAYLSFLLAVALYSNAPHWTGKLDSFTMMRLGATIAEQLPFHMAVDINDVKVLDETPGWIGDATYGKGAYGELALGEGTRLEAERQYRCFAHEESKDRGRWQGIVTSLLHRRSK